MTTKFNIGDRVCTTGLGSLPFGYVIAIHKTAWCREVQCMIETDDANIQAFAESNLQLVVNNTNETKQNENKQ